MGSPKRLPMPLLSTFAKFLWGKKNRNFNFNWFPGFL